MYLFISDYKKRDLQSKNIISIGHKKKFIKDPDTLEKLMDRKQQYFSALINATDLTYQQPNGLPFKWWQSLL